MCGAVQDRTYWRRPTNTIVAVSGSQGTRGHTRESDYVHEIQTNVHEVLQKTRNVEAESGKQSLRTRCVRREGISPTQFHFVEWSSGLQTPYHTTPQQTSESSMPYRTTSHWRKHSVRLLSLACRVQKAWVGKSKAVHISPIYSGAMMKVFTDVEEP